MVNTNPPSSPARPFILVIEDDMRLMDLLKQFLTREGYLVTAAPNAAQARSILDLFIPDLMVVDVMLPDEDGISLVASLNPRPPCLMLTAMGDTDNRIKGLEAGADDYMSKPFDARELALRIGALLRRTKALSQKSNYLLFGSYTFDKEAGVLLDSGVPVTLSQAEIRLLMALADTPNQAVPRHILAAHLDLGQDTRGADMQITRLRRKIKNGEQYIQTVRGVGYVLRV
jgi:two-component system, OmpR family, phosphate regulon response regulator OmpR